MDLPQPLDAVLEGAGNPPETIFSIVHAVFDADPALVLQPARPAALVPELVAVLRQLAEHLLGPDPDDPAAAAAGAWDAVAGGDGEHAASPAPEGGAALLRTESANRYIVPGRAEAEAEGAPLPGMDASLDTRMNAAHLAALVDLAIPLPFSVEGAAPAILDAACTVVRIMTRLLYAPRPILLPDRRGAAAVDTRERAWRVVETVLPALVAADHARGLAAIEAMARSLYACADSCPELHPEAQVRFARCGALPQLDPLDPIALRALWQNDPFAAHDPINCENPGNLCYANAMLQQVARIPRIRDGLLNTARAEPGSFGARLLTELQAVVSWLMLGSVERGARVPMGALLDVMAEPSGAGGFRNARQQSDTREFIQWLASRTSHLMPTVDAFAPAVAAPAAADDTPHSLWDDVFGLRLVDLVRCTQDGCPSGGASQRAATWSRFTELLLHFTQLVSPGEGGLDPAADLSESLERFFAADSHTREVFVCPACSHRHEHPAATWRIDRAAPLPAAIAIPLERVVAAGGGAGVLSHRRFAFPEHLELPGRYFLQAPGAEHKAAAAEPVRLRARSVVVHQGASPSTGHYRSFGREGEQWREYDCLGASPSPVPRTWQQVADGSYGSDLPAFASPFELGLPFPAVAVFLIYERNGADAAAGPAAAPVDAPAAGSFRVPVPVVERVLQQQERLFARLLLSGSASLHRAAALILQLLDRHRAAFPAEVPRVLAHSALPLLARVDCALVGGKVAKERDGVTPSVPEVARNCARLLAEVKRSPAACREMALWLLKVRRRSGQTELERCLAAALEAQQALGRGGGPADVRDSALLDLVFLNVLPAIMKELAWEAGALVPAGGRMSEDALFAKAEAIMKDAGGARLLPPHLESRAAAALTLRALAQALTRGFVRALGPCNFRTEREAATQKRAITLILVELLQVPEGPDALLAALLSGGLLDGLLAVWLRRHVAHPAPNVPPHLQALREAQACALEASAGAGALSADLFASEPFAVAASRNDALLYFVSAILLKTAVPDLHPALTDGVLRLPFAPGGAAAAGGGAAAAAAAAVAGPLVLGATRHSARAVFLSSLFLRQLVDSAAESAVMCGVLRKLSRGNPHISRLVGELVAEPITELGPGSGGMLPAVATTRLVPREAGAVEPAATFAARVQVVHEVVFNAELAEDGCAEWRAQGFLWSPDYAADSASPWVRVHSPLPPAVPAPEAAPAGQSLGPAHLDLRATLPAGVPAGFYATTDRPAPAWLQRLVEGEGWLRITRHPQAARGVFARAMQVAAAAFALRGYEFTTGLASDATAAHLEAGRVPPGRAIAPGVLSYLATLLSAGFHAIHGGDVHSLPGKRAMALPTHMPLAPTLGAAVSLLTDRLALPLATARARSMPSAGAAVPSALQRMAGSIDDGLYAMMHALTVHAPQLGLLLSGSPMPCRIYDFSGTVPYAPPAGQPVITDADCAELKRAWQPRSGVVSGLRPGEKFQFSASHCVWPELAPCADADVRRHTGFILEPSAAPRYLRTGDTVGVKLPPEAAASIPVDPAALVTSAPKVVRAATAFPLRPADFTLLCEAMAQLCEVLPDSSVFVALNNEFGMPGGMRLQILLTLLADLQGGDAAGVIPLAPAFITQLRNILPFIAAQRAVNPAFAVSPARGGKQMERIYEVLTTANPAVLEPLAQDALLRRGLAVTAVTESLADYDRALKGHAVPMRFLAELPTPTVERALQVKIATAELEALAAALGGIPGVASRSKHTPRDLKEL